MSVKEKITIFIADDHAVLRDGLKLILSGEERYEVVGESGDGREAIEMIEKLNPDVTVLDISMPTMSGIEAAKYLKKYVPGTRVIILSRHDNDEYVRQLLKYGISGYVLKDDAGDDLIRAIDSIMKGDIYLSPRITGSIVTEYISHAEAGHPKADESVFDILSGREREVLKLIAEGRNSNEIAQTLRISAKTVKAHRANIMKKVGVHKVAELVTYAVKSGIIEI